MHSLSSALALYSSSALIKESFFGQYHLFDRRGGGRFDKQRIVRESGVRKYHKRFGGTGDRDCRFIRTKHGAFEYHSKLRHRGHQGTSFLQQQFHLSQQSFQQRPKPCLHGQYLPQQLLHLDKYGICCYAKSDLIIFNIQNPCLKHVRIIIRFQICS